LAAGGSSSGGGGSRQQAAAIDVEFVHYCSAGGQGQAYAAAQVCLVDRDLHVLYKTFINPGLPAGARVIGGVRQADIEGAPTLERVGGRDI
jgi:hypothetical protein